MAVKNVAYQSQGLTIKGHVYDADNVEPSCPRRVMGGGRSCV